MRKDLSVIAAVISAVAITGCASRGQGRTPEACNINKTKHVITICVESDPNRAEIHIQTQVKSRNDGRGLFLTEPDVKRRTPYTAVIVYGPQVNQEKPDGVDIVVRATPLSPNIKAVSCKIYDGGVLVERRTALNTYNNPAPVCFYESPVPPPRK